MPLLFLNLAYERIFRNGLILFISSINIHIIIRHIAFRYLLISFTDNNYLNLLYQFLLYVITILVFSRCLNRTHFFNF